MTIRRSPGESEDVWDAGTQVHLETLFNIPPTPAFFMFDSTPIEEQITWLLPAVSVPLATQRERASKDAGNEGFASYLHSLVRSAGIYMLASVASPLVSLVLAPFLTRSLSHADYGTLTILNMAIALLAGLTQLGLGSAFFRAYNYDYSSQHDRAAVLSKKLELLLLLAIPVTIAICIAAPAIGTLLLNNPSSGNLIRLAAFAVLLQNLTLPGFAWMRAENRAAYFALLSILNLLISLFATIALIGLLHMGIAGSVIAICAGYAVVAIFTLPPMLVRAGVRLRSDITHCLLTFGLPNVSNYLSVWVLQLADRFLLAHLGSLSATALYSVAYSLGGVIGVVVLSPFQLAWASTLYAIAKRNDAPQMFQRIFRWYSMILCLAAFTFSLISIFLLHLLFPPAYAEASPIVPIITLSMLFFGIYNFLTLGIGLKRKTWIAAILTALAALVNVGLNFVLIPAYSSTGAALATLLAYLLLAVLAYLVNQRLYPVPFELGRFAFALSTGIVLFVGCSFLAQKQGLPVACAIYLGTLLLYSVVLVSLAELPFRLQNALNILPWRMKRSKRTFRLE